MWIIDTAFLYCLTRETVVALRLGVTTVDCSRSTALDVIGVRGTSLIRD